MLRQQAGEMPSAREYAAVLAERDESVQVILAERRAMTGGACAA